MKKINKKPAFSLMEVMIILLIMAVTLAATAPMISRKMSRNVGTAEEPWKYNGVNQSISFNGNGRDNSTVYIGTDRVRQFINGATNTINRIPLLIRSDIQNRQPAIAFNTTDRIARGGNGRYFDNNGNAYFAQNERQALQAAQDAVANAQAAYDSDPSDANKAAKENAEAQLQAAQNALNNLLQITSDNTSRGFIGYTFYDMPIGQNDIYIPYISNVIPNNDRRFMGIVLGSRLHLPERMGNFTDNVNIFEEVSDKIIIAHDSYIYSRVLDRGNNADTFFMNPERIILIGSDCQLRGKDIIAIGRGVDIIHAWRISARESVLISSGRPIINIIGNALASNVNYSVFYTNLANFDAESQDFRRDTIRLISRNRDANFDRAFTDINNTIHTNNNNLIDNDANKVVLGITGIGQNLFSSGIGHTQIGRQAMCGRISARNNNSPYRSSFSSVAIGDDANAAGSNCVAIGHNIIAGFPSTDSGVANEIRDSVKDSRNSTVAISNSGANPTNATAARAVVIGAGARAADDRNTITQGIVPQTGKIAIGEDAQANSRYAIAIGQQGDRMAVADSPYSIAIGNGAQALANNSIAIGRNASVQAQHANSVAIGAGATTTVINLANNIPRIVLGTAAHTVVIPGDLEIRENFFFKGQPIIVGTPYGYGFTALSDSRLKNLGEKLTSGLEDIKKLEFFNYTFKDDKEQKPHVGVMAQDLQKVFPTSVTEGSDGYLRIRWDEMFYAALNAIKELDRKIIALAQDVKSFFERVDSIELRVAQSQKALDDLKSDFADIDARLKALEEIVSE